MIKDLLLNKTAKEKANLKGQEIAKLVSIPRVKRKDFDIEITELKAIEGGVEFFAKAWDINGQIGFGKDGTVEIERFRIFNPPTMVPDGTKRNEEITSGRSTKIVEVDNFKEDPKEALLLSLEHTIKVSTKNNPRGKIIGGKIGNTTSTFYPDAHTESTSVDGSVYNTLGSTTTWALLKAGAGTTANPSQASQTIAGHYRASAGAFYDLYRAMFLFDTSAIPDADTIDSGTFSVYGSAKSNDAGNAVELYLVAVTPASNVDLVAADFTQFNLTARKSDTNISYASYSVTGYNDYTLNASGLADVSKTAITKFGTVAKYDYANTEPTAGNGGDQVNAFYADTADTTSDPKLVVVHSAASSIKTWNGLAKASVKSINGVLIANVKTVNGIA